MSIYYRHDSLIMDCRSFMDLLFVPSTGTITTTHAVTFVPTPALQYTGSVQVFTAPVDGIYQFELWGSPGGMNGYAGGYTRCQVKLARNSRIYVIVGGSGEPLINNNMVAIGGYNGGGATTTCLAGSHSGSGGGMTHISRTQNVAISQSQAIRKTGIQSSANELGEILDGYEFRFGGSWNPSGTIAVAGGGGGGGRGRVINGDGYGGGNSTSGILHRIDPGNDGLVHRDRIEYRYTSGSTQTQGYMPGCGQGCANAGGGGGGWYGGRSMAMTIQTQGLSCGNPGNGGTSYIQTNDVWLTGQANNQMLNGRDINIPAKPILYEHGYAKARLVQEL